jgi:hypothetical protein
MGETMRVIALAALAAIGFAGAAYAEGKPVKMTDEQMDQVTAGADPGFGVITASGHTLNAGHSEVGLAKAIDRSGRFVGEGRCTAGQVACFRP